MALGDRGLIPHSIKHAILSLCQEVDYEHHLKIEGTICLTIDQDQHVVSIHEFFDKSNDSEIEFVPLRSLPNETMYLPESVTHKNSEHYKIKKATNENAEKNISRSESESEIILIEQAADRNEYCGVDLNNEKIGMQKGLLRSISNSSNVKRHTFQKAFRCDFCKIGFPNKAILNSHMTKEHNIKKQHVCPHCGKKYINIVKFQQHKQLHPKQQDYPCSKCSYTASNALMFSKHMLTHGSPKEYKCVHCNHIFLDPFMYTSHMKGHKDDKHVREYNCCFCSKAFQSFVQFQKHEHTHVRSTQRKQLHSKQQVYHCSTCSFTGTNALMYHKHMLTHGPSKEYKCIHCNLNFSDPFIYTSHMKGHTDDEHVREYNCCFCSKTLQSFAQFQKHEHAHFRNNSKSDKKSSNLPKHTLTNQSIPASQGAKNLFPTSNRVSNTLAPSQKKYKCIQCNLSFSTKLMYTSHTNAHKAKEHVQKYTCSHCSKTLKSFVQFQKHEYAHVLSKQRTCGICNKTFKNSSTLKVHRLTHLPNTALQGARNPLPTSAHVAIKNVQKKTETPFTKTVKDLNQMEMKINKDTNTKINNSNVKSQPNKKKVMFKAPEENTNTGKQTILYQRKTQMTNPSEDSSRQPGSKHNYVYEKETAADNHKRYSPSNQTERINQLRHSIYNRETAAVNTKMYKDTGDNTDKARTFQNTTTIKAKQQLDALRRVINIQSKSGRSHTLNQKEQGRKRPFDNDSKSAAVHKTLKPSTPFKTLPARDSSNADILGPITCGACRASFSHPRHLERHLQIHPDHKL